MNIVKRRFPHTAAALIAFDASAPARAAAWDEIETKADCDAAQLADREALEQVQRAFYEDTFDINSRDSCCQVDVEFMRRMAAEDLAAATQGPAHG